MTKKAVLLLAEGFEELEALAPVDVLRRAGAEVTIAGVGGQNLKSAHGVTVAADVLVENLSGEYDLVVLPGGMPGSKNLGESAAAKALTEKMLASGKLVASICAAPVLALAKWGILDNRNATCYPGMESMFPATVKFSPERVVIDGAITTSRGPGTATDFALAIAAQLMGKEAADQVAKDMLLK